MRLTSFSLSFLTLPLFSLEEFLVHIDGTFYPYVIHEPASDIPKPWPLLIFLLGSGTRTDGDYFAEVAGGHWRLDDVKTVIDAIEGQYDVDEKILLSGYSMGSRGTWRFAAAYPELISAAQAAAGAPENDGDWAMLQEPGWPATFPLVNQLTTQPMWLFASESDTTDTVGDSPARTQETLDVLTSVGNTVSKRTLYSAADGTVHDGAADNLNDMSSRPFTAEAA